MRAVLLDGAIGTELIARGLDLTREPPEAWVLRRPEVLAALHNAYVEAGAAVLQTNTFGGTRPRLAKYQLDGELIAVNREAVALARAAARGRPVYASVGPTGIDAFSSGARDAMRAAYEEQLAALEGVDGVSIETMLHPVEAQAALAAARTVLPRARVIVSATYALGDRGYQTPLGVPLDEMVRAIDGAGPDAIGVNCSLEARKMLAVVRRVRELTALPVVARPQGGPAEVECRGPRRPVRVEDFVSGALALVDLGVAAIGGCCGATPEHIRALAVALAGH